MTDRLTIYASIHARPLRVTGDQRNGWRPANISDTDARQLAFELSITDDGAGQFLLIYHSADHWLSGDTWHETVEDAYVSAERDFGISRKEWVNG
jgi:hypothetical protein